MNSSIANQNGKQETVKNKCYKIEAVDESILLSNTSEFKKQPQIARFLLSKDINNNIFSKREVANKHKKWLLHADNEVFVQ